ncbi:MAG: hypothetical protein WC554_10645 [Clostridia bacterium]
MNVYQVCFRVEHASGSVEIVKRLGKANTLESAIRKAKKKMHNRYSHNRNTTVTLIESKTLFALEF